MSPRISNDDVYSEDTSSLHAGSEISSRPSEKDMTKESLLAAAASRNYQRCYKALRTLETYWAGSRYIVTVLDQKARGSLDPLLYIAEDLQVAVENRNPAAIVGTLGWGEIQQPENRRKSSLASDPPSTLSRLQSALTSHGDMPWWTRWEHTFLCFNLHTDK